MRLKSTYRWVVYKINDAATEVVIEHLGAPTSTYGEFLAHLPESDCRYAVYDYNFMGRDGQEHSKLCFINWAPDVAKVKSKMMFASTKDFFKGSLEGLSLEFQGSEVERRGGGRRGGGGTGAQEVLVLVHTLSRDLERRSLAGFHGACLLL